MATSNIAVNAQETTTHPNESVFSISIWPDLAPGETTKETGTKLPPRDGNGSITRIERSSRRTDDTAAVSTGAAKLYIDLKENGVFYELHIYRSGGHGDGTIQILGRVIHKWPNAAADWLRLEVLRELKPTFQSLRLRLSEDDVRPAQRPVKSTFLYDVVVLVIRSR